MAATSRIRVGIVGANPQGGFAALAPIPAPRALDAAVTRHRLVDAIARAADAGQKQAL